MPTTVGVRDLAEDFAHAVRTHPGRAAIVHNGRSIRYAELHERVRAVAGALGPDPGTVAVFTARTPETVAGLLGVHAAGGAYCPVDPGYPVERQRAMLAATGCRTVLLTGPGQVAPAGVRVVDLTADEPPTETGPAGPTRVNDPDAPAYLLFTSGSTGAPKPVVTPRRAIATATAALRALFGITPTDRVLQFASLSWDTCFEEILPTLTSGAALVLDDEAHTGSFPRFLRMVAARGVTVLDLPTAYWHELVRHLAEDGVALPNCLRLLVIGGEACAPARLADWHALDTADVRLLNTYGCTETTLVTHAAGLDVPVGAPVPIGRALPHVVERIGADGELLIGGPALATGYLGLPGATDERFVTGPEGRFFRTGDRVARTPEGLLVHLGRLDGEVKIRGVRVDPAEVEALVGAHPGVGAVAVTGAEAAGRTILACYVTAAPGTDPAGLRSALLGDLRTRLPGHLVPGRLTVVSELAHTASGKVDRAATHRRYSPDRTHVPDRAGEDER
ncbi:amino acid adenylation domain-containing protein [Longispora sp. K20-0274]|uniref:amino acid adenylation domain-containing protein n=1 Tax=Longispora sp. K20-0274 TaxID=3088255 RepID=UPI00399996F0